jgi:DNA polymerase I-like protein with 3'-5' exonuclease and polymerase domains
VKAKLPKFRLPDDNFVVQDSLFSLADSSDSDFPPIYRDKAGVLAILKDPVAQQGIGLDLEFNPTSGRPSILGVSNRKATSGVPWDSSLAREVVETATRLQTPIVGHSVIGADRPILEGALGIETPLALWDDTMIRHYLCNPFLTKTPSKEEDDSDGDSGAAGYLNLWTMASLYTDLPQWKRCRGKACSGPCPLHQPFDYCAVDSWAGLESKFGTAAEMAQKGIPESLFWDLSVLTEITHKMETRGIKVDTAYVAELEKNFEAHKLEIFPLDDAGEFSPFNPRSPKQVIEYFKGKGIVLAETDKKAVKKALEKECKRRSIDFAGLAEAVELPEELDALYRLFEFKDAGKGLTSWFNERYLDKDGLIHARFLPTGTSMGRLASSRPNLQNVPARGFGSRVRKAIIPRDRSLHLVKADYSQLEFRKMLHSAGFDPRDLKSDPFAGLVDRSNGQMKPAAEFLHGAERDVAKSLVHAYDYLEGVTVLKPRDLEKRKKEIDDGALLVYRDWEYAGGLVGFTGGNLAERLFGNKTWESRKKALALQELVTAEFPMLRQLHRKIFREIEEKKGVQLQTGRFLPLDGSPEDNAKMGAAVHGQGGGAEHVIGVMLRYYQELGGVYPVLQVHDELVFEIPAEWTEQQARDFIYPMTEETHRMPGFVCPVKAKRGLNWKEMEEFSI